MQSLTFQKNGLQLTKKNIRKNQNFGITIGKTHPTQNIEKSGL